jgi:ABC-type multidrug transport system fused ATPase/permease subunit
VGKADGSYQVACPVTVKDLIGMRIQQRGASGTSLGKLYGALWRNAEGSRHLVVTFIFLLVVGQAARLAIPYFFGNAVNDLQRGGNDGVPQAGIDMLWMLGFCILGWALHGPGRIIERFTALRIRERFVDTLYRKLMSLPMGWHESHHTGETIQRISKADVALFDFSQNQFLYLQSVVSLVGPVVALCAISGATGVAAMAGYAMLGVILYHLDRAMARLADTENRAGRRYSAELVDSLGNVSTVMTLRLQDAMRTAMTRRLHDMFAPIRRSILLCEAKWCTLDLIGNLFRIGLVAFYVWLLWREGASIMVGTAVMVYQYSQQIGDTVGTMATHWQGVVRCNIDLSGADEILDVESRHGLTGDVDPAWREIEVSGLTFRHPNHRSPKPTLDEVFIDLRRGARIALVGESGSGKSSLMRVLSGLHDADRVSIAVDGKYDPALTGLGMISTLIPQDPEIFENTVAYNITMGLDHSEEEVRRACDLACLTPIVQHMPQDLGTVIVERGGNLSGGQKQRLALARGILAAKRSSVIMLDEPTSSLDPATESRVYANLMEEFPKACIVSSIHRLHLLTRFDIVVFMQDGHVADAGTLDELIARQPRFREMWREVVQSDEPQAALG